MSKMKKNTESGSGAALVAHRGLVIALNIISVLAAIHLVFAVFFMLSEFREAGRTYFNAQSLRYSVTDAQYGSLTERYFEEGIPWRGVDRDTEEYAALAEYTNAAFRYKTYTASGDRELAEKAAGRMEEAKSRLDLLLMDTEQIDRAAGLNGEDDDQQ